MNQNDKRYNGWTNYETWVTALWLDNDCATQCYWKETTSEIKEAALRSEQVAKGYWTIEEAPRFLLADRLKDEVTDNAPTGEASLYADLLGAALQEVSWVEIAEHLLAEE